MALLIEIADYYLHQLAEVPEKEACTERARRWGIPAAGERDFPKAWFPYGCERVVNLL